MDQSKREREARGHKSHSTACVIMVTWTHGKWLLAIPNITLLHGSRASAIPLRAPDRHGERRYEAGKSAHNNGPASKLDGHAISYGTHVMLNCVLVVSGLAGTSLQPKWLSYSWALIFYVLTGCWWTSKTIAWWTPPPFVHTTALSVV